MRKILIEESTGKIISLGARDYLVEEGQIMLDLTSDLGMDTNLHKSKQYYDGKKIKKVK